MASTKKNTDLIDHAKRFKNMPWCEDYEKMISGMLYERGFQEITAIPPARR
jgi:hypothetical protein